MKKAFKLTLKVAWLSLGVVALGILIIGSSMNPDLYLQEGE